VLSHFLIEAGKQGSYIVATDLDTALKEPIQLKVDREGKICIPARKMFEIIREVDGDVSCESVDDQWLKVKAGASSFRLACLPAKEFPAWPGMEDMEEVTIAAPVLAEVIEKCVYAAGESDTRYTLNGLLFHLTADQGLTVVGTDGHRLAIITRGLEGKVREEKKIIIPRKAAVELRKLVEKSEEKIRVVIGRNHVLFTVGDVQFLTRLIEGTYPNYEQVIPAGNDKRVVLQRDTFGKTARRVAIMSRERSNAIKMDLADNLVTITSSNPDLGEAKDEIAVDYSGETLSLGFNARYLIDILDAMSAERVVMELQAPLSPVLIREEQDEAYRCVVMPMRI
jgi:DNA polymerase-3 subunit beta